MEATIVCWGIFLRGRGSEATGCLYVTENKINIKLQVIVNGYVCY